MSDSKFNLLDKAIAFVRPDIAVDRAVARYSLDKIHNFNEADTDEPGARGRSGGRTKHGASESGRRQKKRVEDIWNARDMEERFCLVRGILDRLEQYVCGQMTYQSRTGDQIFDKQYQDHFHKWCGNCDITGRHRFREMVGQGFRGMIRDGEFGWNMLMRGAELKLQPIEADRIGGNIVGKTEERNIGGILIDEVGAVTGYEIYKRSRLAQYTKEMEAKPANFIHLFKALRPDQYHGESLLSPALPHARDILEVIAFEKQAMKFAAAFAGFIKRKDPMGTGTSWTTRKGGPGTQNEFAAKAGMIKILAEGEEIQFPASTGRPSGNLIQFVEILIREIALGLNLPFGFVYNMAALGGVTARIELMQVVRSIRKYQQMLEDIVLDRVKNEVLNLGIAMGEIPWHPNFESGKWSYGARLTGDSGNYTQEIILLLQHGLVSPSDVIEELSGSSNGDVVAKIVADIKETQEAAAEGVPMELISPSRFGQATQLLAAINTPPSNPPEPRGLVAKQGEKAAAPLLDVLEKYADGRLERESAITTLVHLYAMTRAKAEKIIPEKRPEPNETDGGKDE